MAGFRPLVVSAVLLLAGLGNSKISAKGTLGLANDFFLSGQVLPIATLNSVPESSGLVYTGGKLYTHADSGNSSEIYSIDPESGIVVQTLVIDNFPNVDWEDITADQDYIYIGDFGNNNGTRTDLKALKISKNQIGSQQIVHLQAEAISFSYRDQKSFAPDSQTNFDCESLISVGDSLYLFTKDRGDFKTRLYSLSKNPGNYQISPIASLNVGGQICGADYEPGTNQIALIGYGGSKLNSFIYRLTNFSETQFFAGQKEKIIVGNNFTQWQTEGICFFDSSHLFISCESTPDVSASLYLTDLNQIITTPISEIPSNIVECFPNPAADYLEIFSDKNISSIALCDNYGRAIYYSSAKGNQFRLNLVGIGLKNGIYLLKIHNSQKVTVKKIVVRH